MFKIEESSDGATLTIIPAGRFDARKAALRDLVSAYSGAIPNLAGQAGAAGAAGYGYQAQGAQNGANFAQGQVPDIGSLYQLYLQTQRQNPGYGGGTGGTRPPPGSLGGM